MLDTRTDLSRRVLDALYVDAMVLADEARSYFDRVGRADRDGLPPVARIDFSCEALRVTTRLMHVIAWLLMQRAIAAGELSAAQASSPERRLGHALPSDPEVVAQLPPFARALVTQSEDLYARIGQLDARSGARDNGNPVIGLISRLQNAF